MSVRLSARTLLPAAVLLLLSGIASADTGSIVTATGEVSVERRGRQMAAGAGFGLEPGDTIHTGAQSKAQFHLTDDSVFAVPQGGSLRIDTFNLPRQHPDGIGQSVLSLVRGGFRTITGLIGKSNRDFYEVRTSVATIGVRGTEYAALMCEGACTKEGKYKAGLYVKDEKGVVIVKNRAGRLRLRPGQVAFVASANTPPVLVKVHPFDDPAFYAEFSITIGFDAIIEPPRIEQEPPASPSRP